MNGRILPLILLFMAAVLATAAGQDDDDGFIIPDWAVGSKSGLVLIFEGGFKGKEIVLKQNGKVIDAIYPKGRSPFVKKYLIQPGVYRVITPDHGMATKIKAVAGALWVVGYSENTLKGSLLQDYSRSLGEVETTADLELASSDKFKSALLGMKTEKFKKLPQLKDVIVLELRSPIPRPPIPRDEEQPKDE